MKFTKMHGSGNDYVYINCFDERIDNPEELAVIISDRHRGIGSDGLVLIMPSDSCDFRMRMFNADGSEAQMCGNASHCVGKYVYDNGMTDKTELLLETLSGVKRLRLYPEDGKIKKVRVDMGEPILKSTEIPVLLPADTVTDCSVHFSRMAKNITCVSMGNPHTVIFEKDVDRLNISEIGREIEQHPVFPERTNVEFVKCLNSTHLKMRVWERGSGETQACGTGACAALVAAVLNGKAERKATVCLPGGKLEIEWNKNDNHVYLTGDAVSVFSGEWKMKPPLTPPKEGNSAVALSTKILS